VEENRKFDLLLRLRREMVKKRFTQDWQPYTKENCTCTNSYNDYASWKSFRL